jgi:AcrR family transcriptional regulator
MDHRIKVAEKKRVIMRAKLIDAATRVFAERVGPTPVIDDVVREAKVSRGTFYNYFDSLDEVLAIIGQELSNQMTTDILPAYDVLTEPWQRACVGFRVFLIRALLDRKWAGFVTRPDAWPHHALVARYMAVDLDRGRRIGQFHFDNVDATSDFLMGASMQAIELLCKGMDEPNTYMDIYTRLAMTVLGCHRSIVEQAVVFSLDYLQRWASGDLGIVKPIWAFNLNSKEGQAFLAHRVAGPST